MNKESDPKHAMSQIPHSTEDNQASSPSSNVSRKTRLSSTAAYHQGYNIHVRIVKFASTSQPVASSSNTDTSVKPSPVRRQSTELIGSPPPEEEQIKPSDLARYRVKVRDFAYESSLPPIAPYVRKMRAPLQVQAGPRLLKRARQEYDREYDDPFRAGPSQMRAVSSGTGISRPGAKRSKPLGREVTEPVEGSQPLMRERGFEDLTEYEAASQSQSQSQPTIESISSRPHPRTPISLPPLYTNAQSQNTWNPDYSSPSQQPPHFAYSQESEPYIDTPLVTPNGSLQWPEPDVRINSTTDSQMDTDSQLPPPDLFSYSQMGLTHPQSQIDNASPSQPGESQTLPPPNRRCPSSPLSSVPASPLPVFTSPKASPGPSTGPSCPPPSSPSPLTRSPRRTEESEPPSTTVGSSSRSRSRSPPRYNLRKRQATSPARASAPPPAQRSTRSRSRQRQALPPRPPPFTIQASHAKGKGSNSQSSSRAKTLRNPRSTTGTNGRRDERAIMG